MAVQIQNRRDTAANWTTADTTLANGEIGFETDTGKLKVGDGSTAWTSLNYIDNAITHDDLISGTIADHDTTATGTELNTLTDNSIADTLHRHSELVASDGSPDPALSVNVAGRVGIGTTGPSSKLQIGDNTADVSNILLFGETTEATQVSLPRIHQQSILSAGTGNDLALGSASTNGGILFYTGAVTGQTSLLGTNSNTAKMVIKNNGNIGIGITTPAASAVLDLTSTTGALLLTRMTTAQKNALTAVNGMILYDTTLNKTQVYEGGAWASVI